MSLFSRLKALFRSDPPANDANAPDPPPHAKDVTVGDTSKASAAKPRGRARESGAPARWSSRDDARVEAEARALFDAGDPQGGIALLAAQTALFARHERTTLPCLCRRCLRPELADADGAGLPFVRDFVVSSRHTLFYWSPAELARDAKHLRTSMRAELRARLRVRAKKLDEPRQGMNPFTKQPITIPASAERRRCHRVNPLTGKPLP